MQSDESIDIIGLRGGFPITQLFLKAEEIYNADAIGSLENLEELHINPVREIDISWIENNLKLSILYLTNGNPTGIAKIQHLNQLKELGLINCTIEEISWLEPIIHNIKYLYLMDNKIEDISVLKNANELVQLVLTSNIIKDASFLEDLPKLERLEVDDNL